MLADSVGVCNIDEPLHQSRIRSTSVSFRHERVQTSNFVALAKDYLRRTLDLSLDRGVHRVIVNRMDSDVTPDDLARGLGFLQRIQDAFLAGLTKETEDREEVTTIADEQRADILIQALLKGPRLRRGAALGLVLRYAPSLMSLPTRRYIGTKIGFGRPREVLLASARR